VVDRAAGMAIIELNPMAAARVAAGEFSWAEGSAGPWATTVRELVAGLAAGWPALQLTADRR